MSPGCGKPARAMEEGFSIAPLFGECVGRLHPICIIKGNPKRVAHLRCSTATIPALWGRRREVETAPPAQGCSEPGMQQCRALPGSPGCPRPAS